MLALEQLAESNLVAPAGSSDGSDPPPPWLRACQVTAKISSPIHHHHHRRRHRYHSDYHYIVY